MVLAEATEQEQHRRCDATGHVGEVEGQQRLRLASHRGGRDGDGLGGHRTVAHRGDHRCVHADDLDEETPHRPTGLAGGHPRGDPVYPLPGHGSRSRRFVQGEPPDRRPSAGRTESAHGADAMGEDIDALGLPDGQMLRRGENVVVLLGNSVPGCVPAHAPAAAVHRGDPAVPGQQRPHRFPPGRTAHPSVNEQQPRTDALGDHADLDAVRAGHRFPLPAHDPHLLARSARRTARNSRRRSARSRRDAARTLSHCARFRRTETSFRRTETSCQRRARTPRTRLRSLHRPSPSAPPAVLLTS